MSFSKKGVIRGMHLQTKKSQGKFVSVIKGKIFDVVIDLRKNSKTFGKQYHSTLSEKIRNQFIYHQDLLTDFKLQMKKIILSIAVQNIGTQKAKYQLIVMINT